MFRPTGSILRQCRIGVAAVGVLLTVVYGQRVSSGSEGAATVRSGGSIALPEPRVDGELSVEQALARRRSLRKFAHAPLPLSAVSQLLWAAQGITHPDGMRTAPSAGALYPLEVYLVAGAVTGLEPGVYHYEPGRHRLVLGTEGDVRVGVARAALGQDWISEAPAILVLGAVYERTERKYRQRTARYVHIESGHAAQNVYLQAEALGLGTTIVGAFHDGDLTRVVGLSGRVKPLVLLPVGRRR
jgi:SagB-type dehydrogenase family enzyme